MTRQISRRTILGAGGGTALAGSARTAGATTGDHRGGDDDPTGRSLAELQRLLARGRLSSRDLTRAYLRRIERIDAGGPRLASVIEVNPDAERIARELDRERRRGHVRGPLHGIPVLVKDNIDTDDAMLTTAGSLALVDSRPGADATVVARMREAGMVLLGKTNLSEWANFRGDQSSGGWSARGGQTKNPYVLPRNPSGSSSGSAAAVSAFLAPVTLGTETDGSIVSPAQACGVVGIKPTVGLTSRAGVVPISRTQDTVGPLGRTVADAAAVLGVLAGPDPRDEATADSEGRTHEDYTRFLRPDGLAGARIGVPRQLGVDSPEATAVFEESLAALRAAGAVLVDPVDIPSYEEFSTSSAEFEVLLWEFKAGIADYLATRTAGSPRTLADLIELNLERAEEELRWFGQETFELAQAKTGLDDPEYARTLATSRRISRTEGLDAVLDEHDLDALVAPTGGPAWVTDLVNGDNFLGGTSSYAAMAGYPLVTVPSGAVFGLPLGLTFMGRAWSEPTLLRLAGGFEAQTRARSAPRYRSSVTGDGRHR
ncbi:N-carbamoylputrescine amidase [Serinicoccus hydrothermalis]|uniref:N-carbamoylputrescine amidase n=1 Tax=Serinicoccus hydrothermalis TaxID=1758689 RepID=A0A1B1NAL1_9MICO|nr:amidase [Serinicoccus hydrothermalis]ANS78483.1 N-carbamoylputrescine amidase [Serinicoccus hydrothermalis]